jgi:hypothetical protein
MSDGIKDALTADFISRMQDWARGQEVPIVASSWPSDGPGAGIGSTAKYHVHRIPPLLGRAQDTGMALSELPVRYKQAVKQFWIYEGQTLRWHGRHRGVDHKTFKIWVIKGHELLKAEFAARVGRWQRLKEAAQTLMCA